MTHKSDKKLTGYKDLDFITTLHFNKENFYNMQRILSDVVAENIKLAEISDKLIYQNKMLIDEKTEKEKHGRIKLNLDVMLNLIFFERFILKQSSCFLVHYNNKFVRFEPSDLPEEKPITTKENYNGYDSIY